MSMEGAKSILDATETTKSLLKAACKMAEKCESEKRNEGRYYVSPEDAASYAKAAEHLAQAALNAYQVETGIFAPK